MKYDFYPRPPRGGRHITAGSAVGDAAFLSTPSARRATPGGVELGGGGRHFYPRPPRGGRRRENKMPKRSDVFLSTPSARRATRVLYPLRLQTWYFYPRPPRGGRPTRRSLGTRSTRFLSTPSARRATIFVSTPLLLFCISIHALREEGDSKNGEKHLRFCFSIKRSAQIWKSFSKNIRKKSRDLHRKP